MAQSRAVWEIPSCHGAGVDDWQLESLGGQTKPEAGASQEFKSKAGTAKAHARFPKKAEKGLFSLLCAWLVDHQIGLSINFLLLLSSSYLLFPSLRPFTSKFLTLSYYHPDSDTYTRGYDDAYYVCTWMAVFIGLRVAVIDYVLKPMARAGGIKGRKRQERFAEQGWIGIYDSCSWSLGMYIMYQTKYWLNLRELWTEWPTRAIDPLMKWYYLVQTGFWMAQLLVVNVEERRSDHWQMLTHHIFTNALLLCSYGYYETKAGNVILCIMDVVDIFLAAAKMLNYLNWRMACDTTFGVFLLVWLGARHICYLLVMRSIWVHVPQVMPLGCYTFKDNTSPAQQGVLYTEQYDYNFARYFFHPFVNSEANICYNPMMRYAFLVLMGALQILMVVWFWMIVRVAIRVLVGKGADDVRSDDEEEEEKIEFEEQQQKKQMIGSAAPVSATPGAQLHASQEFQEEEVGVDGLHFVKSRRKASPPVTRSRTRKGAGRASGISIAGHSEPKELLGRIGCDKPS